MLNGSEVEMEHYDFIVVRGEIFQTSPDIRHMLNGFSQLELQDACLPRAWLMLPASRVFSWLMRAVTMMILLIKASVSVSGRTPQ